MLRNPPKITQLISNEAGGHQPRSICSLTLKPCNNACALNTMLYPHRHDCVIHKTTLIVSAQFISVVMPSFRWGFQLKMLGSNQRFPGKTQIKALFPQLMWPSLYPTPCDSLLHTSILSEKSTRRKVSFVLYL